MYVNAPPQKKTPTKQNKIKTPEYSSPKKWKHLILTNVTLVDLRSMGC